MAVALPTPPGAGDVWGTQLNAWLNTANQFFNVMLDPYNAKGDNSNDDTSAIQAALNAAGANGGPVGNNKGGIVVLPKGRYRITSTLTIPENVTLVGQGRGSNLANNPATILDCSGVATPIITGNGNAITIMGIAFYGKNATGSKGIYVTGGGNWTIRDCTFSGFGDQALHITAGASNRIENCYAQSSLLVRTGRSTWVGVFDIASTDTVVSGCELTSSSNALDTGVNGYICALAVRGDDSFIGPGNQFELSETGVFVDPGIVSGAGVTFVDCRADLNQGSGFLCQGNFCAFIGCWAWRNSQGAGNSYDGFAIQGNNNSVIGCRIGNLGTGGELKHRYGISDASQNNLFVGNTNSNVQTGMYSISNATTGCHSESRLSGSGSPAGVVSAQPGVLYVETGGGAGITLWVKETGTAASGWVGVKEAGGISTQTPGAVATVNIPHGLGVAPNRFTALPNNANARGAPSVYVTADATNVILNFSANLAGATSYAWVWTAGI